MKCVCCSSENLEEYLNLGVQPLANDYDGIGGKHPLIVVFCQNCSHSQLKFVVSPGVMFDNYYYTTGVSQIFQNHFRELSYAALRLASNDTPRVLDIGCNDGTLLSYFKEKGCEVLGVDPAKNLLDYTNKLDIHVRTQYWGSVIDDVYSPADIGKFDIITATNVFAHTPNPKEFLLDCQRSLKLDGTLIIEVPYVLNMLGNNAFDMIYHEHVSYFTIKSFMTLVNSIGMSLYKAECIPIHGGSLRLFVRHFGTTPQAQTALALEDSFKLGLFQTYQKFGETVENLRDVDFGSSVGYGAAAKSTVALNYLSLKLDYIVDDSKLKWGKKIPGTDIVIENPGILVRDKPELITVCAWNLLPEIIGKIKKFGLSGKVQTYIPKHQIISI